ncbi:MAG: hypothetical protein M9962_03540 [Oligoflexia bacterium]|nr:hypothetical protein [Oligoflexia bacterium]
MKLSFFAYFRPFIFTLLVFSILSCGKADSFAGQDQASDRQLSALAGSQISFDEEELNTKYGEYFEGAFELVPPVNAPVYWQEIGSQLPPGLYLEDSQSSNILLFGNTTFTGRWCFNLAALDQDGNEIHSREVCLNSENNDEYRYPRFSEDSVLHPAKEDESYHTRVKVLDPLNERAEFSGEVVDEESLPEALTIGYRTSGKYFSIRGTFREEGLVRFALKATDEFSIENYQQFQLRIREKNDGVVACPPGYYYDEDLGYCVQDGDNDRVCPPGTYLDPDSGQCVAYPPPPPNFSCGPNHHYDPYLDRCVRNGYPRCPIGTHWDSYRNRCVADQVRCAPGYRYSYVLNRCVWKDPARVCAPGEHYDYQRNRCVPNHVGCPAGYVWSPARNQCVPSNRPRLCRPNEIWDPARRQCIPRGSVCGPGQVYDPVLGRCVRRNPPACPPGQRWSPRDGRCIDIVAPMPPMPMPPGPMPMPPGPMPMPPGPMPMPPGPMPMPPGPMPMPPGPMPMPPGPMPMPPGPMPMPPPFDGPRPMPMGMGFGVLPNNGLSSDEFLRKNYPWVQDGSSVEQDLDQLFLDQGFDDSSSEKIEE